MIPAAVLLSIHHRTIYRYRRPVTLQPHRLLLCPRGDYDLKLLTTSLSCTPSATIEWTQDVFGNLIATAAFAEAASMLTIDSRMVVEQAATAWPIFPIAPCAHNYPFRYAPDELLDLGPLLAPIDDGLHVRAHEWAEQFAGKGLIDTLTMLKAINAAVHEQVGYRRRDEQGTQTPDETLALATGSCRDMATLFIEAVRHLGIAARAVSGYLFDPDRHIHDEATGEGATHAWAEVYLPGAGWIAFDPASGSTGSANLVPVAVGRTLRQIMPVVGSFIGVPDDFLKMEVHVSVMKPVST